MTEEALSVGQWEAVVKRLGHVPDRGSITEGDLEPGGEADSRLRPPPTALALARPLLAAIAVGAVAIFAVGDLTSGFASAVLTALGGALLGFVVVLVAEELAIRRLQRLPSWQAARDLLPTMALITWEYLDTLWSHLTDRRDIGPLTALYVERRREEPTTAPDCIELRKLVAVARYVEERARDAWDEQGRWTAAHFNGPPPARSPRALVWFGGQLPDTVVLGLYIQQQADWLDALARSCKEFAFLVDHPALVQVSQAVSIAATRLRNFAAIHLRRDDPCVDPESATNRSEALMTTAVERDQASYSGPPFPWLEEARLQEAVAESLNLVGVALRAVLDLYTALVLHAPGLDLKPAKPFEYNPFDDLDGLETEGEVAARTGRQAEFERAQGA